MTENKVVVERRGHKRYKARAGSFTVLRGDSSKLGIIVDIGRGGLAFRYIASEYLSNGSTELDILLANSGFSLEKVPFEVISDIEIPNEAPFSSMRMRRCSVQFGKLTANQLTQLEYFIRNYSAGEA